MKKRNKLISLGVLTTTIFYSCSPVLTLAVTEEQASTVQSSDSLKEDTFSTYDSISSESTQASINETSSSEEAILATTESENEYFTADISAFMDKEINLVPGSNSELHFSESENGLAVIGTNSNLTKQTFSFQQTEDGWLNIQNNSTKNYLTIDESNDSLYFTDLQESDKQKWHFVNEENGTYYIESKTKQLLVITEDNSLKVSNGEVKQRWLIEVPTQEDSSTESSTIESTTSTTNTTNTTNESSTNFQEPKAISAAFNVVEQIPIDKTKIKITIKNPNGGNVSNVQFPTWSSTNGQDDIKWLNGTKNADGSWSVTIDVNQYKHDGKFLTHIYTKVDGKDTYLASTSYNLEFSPTNVITKTAVGKDKMKITIANPNRGDVSNVQFPTWSSTNGQDDIKWLNGTKNVDGSWSVIVNANEYKHDGQFNTHIYAKVNGKDKFLASTSYNLEFTNVNKVEQTAIGKNKMKITIFNPNRGNVSNVQFPTWSSTNGQDDIKWLNGVENADGSWSVTVNANEYKHGGQFNTHIYTKVNGKDTFLASTSYKLDKMVSTHLFVMGHGGWDPGAVGNGTNEREFTRNELLPILKKYASQLKGSAVSFYDPSRDMYQDSKIMNGAYAVSSDISSVTEIHLDSGTIYSTGGHVIITPGAKTEENKNISAVIRNNVGWNPSYAYNFGFSERTDLLNLNVFNKRNIPYRLTELGFISNSNDLNTIRKNKEKIAKELIEQTTGEKIQ